MKKEYDFSKAKRNPYVKVLKTTQITIFFLLLLFTLPSYALRIISLAPNLTEMVYAVGAGKELVGVSEYSDFPTEAQHLPVISRFEHIDVEGILLLKPDLVLAWKGSGEESAINSLQDFGISVQWISTSTLLEIPSALAQIGELTHHEAAGKKAAQAFGARYQALKEKYSHPGNLQKTVFLELFDSPLYTAGKKSFLMNILDICGAKSAFPSLNTEASSVSLESVVAANPSIIIALEPADISRWQAWPMMEAVKTHQVSQIDPNILARPGPRILEGVSQVCEWINR